ncbi:MAG: hypothetical protein P8O98_00950 [Flavobacteriaceae bacterium]|jgi:hypothetical protein|nr:hypothetical protein [Flavobacteriaceae bacterium]MBT6127127.1 hypothetical protein [Flavobacteriaceae bacterium]MDG1027553.1 hypothetical protein [Flavobacteriaceae bacterium]MDG1942027.1 hypothetical protein [Flavobacteriaceae bacterium]
MNRLIYLLFVLLLISCSKESSDSNSDVSSTENNSSTSDDNSSSEDNSSSDDSSSPNDNSSEVKVVFNSNVHSSLPKEWVDQYNIILATLDKRIPVYTNNYNDLDIYAWNSNTDKPYRSEIGDASGACICGNDQKRYMVLEIPNDEFEYNSMHRYSVIAHEFFHAYQMSISANFNSGDFRVKWLNEGTAAVFESLYVREHYDYNYFIYDQDRVDQEAVSNPSIYESYDSGGDSNYSSSVFMTLALVKELVKLENTEADAIRMILKDFQQQNPGAANWKDVFLEVFSISVDSFYSKLSSYQADINTVLPSEDLTLEGIFNN